MRDPLALLRGLISPDLLPPPTHFEGMYRAFTTDHDQVVRFTTMEDMLARVRPDSRFNTPPFDAYLEKCVPLYETAAQRLLETVPTDACRGLAVTLLLDHSGSLRGEPAQRLAATAGVASECLDRLGIAHEVLAFTTSSWHGGASYRRWLREGSPPNPGRLCDLLHIVYRAFDDSGPVTFDALEQMTQAWLLKENVDGEAVLWAADRLRAHPASRRVLIVMSDGAPVDDKTLLANGPNILDEHLHLVTTNLIREQAIEVYGFGIGWAMHRYYPQYAVLNDQSDIGEVALPILAAILASPAHRPFTAPRPLPSLASD